MKKYLYKINDYTDNIEIYKVVPRLKDISEFREKTINDDIVYDAIVNTSVNKADISSKYRITPDKYDRDLKENEVNNEYHRLVKSTNKDKCMIDNYIMDGIDADSYLYHVVGYKNYGLIIPSLEYNFYTKNSYIIKNILKIPDELYVLERIIKGEYSRIDDHYLDSLAIISLVAELEDEFDIVIPTVEIIPDNFNSAKAMWEMITRLQEEG